MMQTMTVTIAMVVWGAAGLAAGGALGWWAARMRAAAALAARDAERAAIEAAFGQERQVAVARARDHEERVSELQARLYAAEREQKATLNDLSQAREGAARLESSLQGERQAAAERVAALQEAEQRLTQAFAALSAEALDASTKRFLELAASRFDTLRSEAGGDLDRRQAEIAGVVAPVKDVLTRLEQTLGEVERTRGEDKGRLLSELAQVNAAHQGLQDETRKLVRALQVPHVRGRWGELQLQRVVELAGMEEYCDIRLQHTIPGEAGPVRPDLIVMLPGGRTVVVDAKAPVTAYLDAISTTDDAQREARLRDHAAQVRSHVAALGAKAYWERLPSTPDFVVLFLPGESFFSAAVQYDPSLFEYGVSQRVFLAGPFTLLALLRTVAHGWSQEKLAENARVISDLGKELYERLASMTEHFADMRSRLQGAVDAYNRTVGSLESRVLPSARRFRDLGVAASKEVVPLVPVDQTPRRLQAPDMVPPPEQLTLEAELVGRAAAPLEPRDDD